MSFTFNGVKKDGNGAYYYNDGDVESHRIPLSDQCYGDVRMSREQLEECLLHPARLDSTWGGTAGGGWWNVTGDIVVYKPIEWVPSVARIRDFPKNSIVTNIEKERVETTTTKLYAKAEFALEVSAGGNYMGIKAEAKAKTETGVEFEKEVRNKDTYTQKGVVGDVALVEVAVGLMLRVEEIYTHNIKVWVDGREKGDSLGWHGGPSWNDIHIPSRSLSRVGGLQFSKITMTGGGHSAGLYVQTLPVFDENKELKDLHIALSNVGWTDWYAYVAGKKGRSSGRQLLAYPNYRPSTTLMPLNKTPAKTE
ncbi:hypothetical protein QL093DRAFT_2575451 [Fusarium oxysporum]|nr:hypothetical protein QL093DRAFT_2575451 [Fusarium oxysporum]